VSFPWHVFSQRVSQYTFVNHVLQLILLIALHVDMTAINCFACWYD
jgi:hypothetical protein